MQDYNVNEILLGIKQHDNNVLYFVYNKFFKDIKYFITKNTGDEEDARDIFQEALIVIYRQIKEQSLALTCTFKTYLYSVCRLLWLKQLKRKKIEMKDVYDLSEEIEIGEDQFVVFEDSEKYGLYQSHYNKLADDCKKLLMLFLENHSLSKIAEMMGYKSENYAKKKKFYCKEHLIKSIIHDPKYKELV